MPEKLIKEFIDKDCIVTLVGDNHLEIKGKIIDIEGYWIKIKENKTIRLINGVLIRDIKTLDSN